MALPSHWSAPQTFPPATTCQGAAASGPAQPLVGAVAGPAHKPPTIKKRPSVRRLRQHWSDGLRWIRVFSLRRFSSLALGRGLGAVSAGLRSPHQGQPPALAWALRQRRSSPHSRLCDLLVLAVCLGHSLRELVSPLWAA